MQPLRAGSELLLLFSSEKRKSSKILIFVAFALRWLQFFRAKTKKSNKIHKK
jgi:hypothetical protein